MYLQYIVAASAAMGVFLVASVQDLHERAVSDMLWLILGGIAFVLLALDVYTASLPMPGASSLVLLLPLFLFADMFLDWEKFPVGHGTLLRFLLAALLLVVAAASVMPFLGMMDVLVVASLPAWILFVFVLYKVDVIKGGADAKALVALCVLFPMYPPAVSGAVQPLYATLTFPFFISVLMMGAIFSLAVPVSVFMLNLTRGNVRLPHMLLGLEKRVEDVNLSKEWLLETADAGGGVVRVRKLGSLDEAAALALLRETGRRLVWVSPKIPFMLPLTAGMIFVLVFGNPLLYI